MGFPFESDRMDWETPPDLFDALNDEFGFTIDVCATPKTAKVARYYTPETDGLSQDWGGERCFMNPPYGRDVYEWVGKAATTPKSGGGSGRPALRAHGHALVARLRMGW